MVAFLLRGAVGAAPNATNIPPVEWTFERPGDFQGWQPNGDLTNNLVANGALSGLVRSNDPFWVGPAFRAVASNFPYVVVRMKVQHPDGKAFANMEAIQLFWVTMDYPGSEAASLMLDVIDDGQWHDYTFYVGENNLWKGTITGLRIDPVWRGLLAQVSLDSIRLQAVPGKDYVATFMGKTYEAVVKETVNVLIYPTDKGVRIGKPFEVSSYFKGEPNVPPPKVVLRFAATEAPIIQPHKMVIHAQSTNGIPLLQTWKFSDNSITIENQIKKYPYTEPDKWVCTYIRWPSTHTFAPNVEKIDREKATAGYTWRARAGKTPTALKTFTWGYTQAVNANYFESLENHGPWGAHTVTLRRKTTVGHMGPAFDGTHIAPYEGLGMVWVSYVNPKLAKMDTQAIELSIK